MFDVRVGARSQCRRRGRTREEPKPAPARAGAALPEECSALGRRYPRNWANGERRDRVDAENSVPEVPRLRVDHSRWRAGECALERLITEFASCPADVFV